jgi:hypothetical protein
MTTVFVTGFYTITSEENPIQAEKTDTYFNHAAVLLACPVRFVVYCDPCHAERIRSLRSDAVVVARPFKNFPQHAWIERIRQNRVDKPYRQDPRNTPTYCAITLSKFQMMLEVAQVYPADNVAWVDFGIQKLHPQFRPDLLHAVERTPSDRFRVCMIDLLPRDWVLNYDWFYQQGRCMLGATAMYGSRVAVERACLALLDEAEETIARQYGHAEEQVMATLFVKRPDLFSFWFSEYQGLLENVEKVTTNQGRVMDVYNKSIQYNYPEVVQAVIKSLQA